MGVERPLDVDLLPCLATSLNKFEIARDGAPFAGIQIPRPLITYPRVRASSAGVDP